VSTSTLGMDNSLRDTLSIEMSKLVDKVEILEKKRSTRSSRHGVLVVVNRGTVGSGKYFALH